MTNEAFGGSRAGERADPDALPGSILEPEPVKAADNADSARPIAASAGFVVAVAGRDPGGPPPAGRPRRPCLRHAPHGGRRDPPARRGRRRTPASIEPRATSVLIEREGPHHGVPRRLVGLVETPDGRRSLGHDASGIPRRISPEA